MKKFISEKSYNELINFIKNRIEVTTNEISETEDFQIKITKGAKKTAYNEILNQIGLHSQLVINEENKLYIWVLREVYDTNGLGLTRNFLSAKVIKACDELVKEGYLQKGKSDEKNSTVSYFLTSKGSEYLDNI